MKNRFVLSAPLYVAVILLLFPISEKLLALSGDSSLVITASAVQLFIFAVPAAFYCKIRGVSFTRHAKIKAVSIYDVPFTLAAALTYFFTAIILLYLEYRLFPVSAGTLSSLPASIEEPAEIILFYIIVPAIAEEIFFRSIILSDYGDVKGPIAISASAIFFAMLHFSFPNFPRYFVLSLILGMITYVTGSSFPSMIIHLINNTLTIFFSDFVGSFLKGSANSVILAFILVVAFMASLALMLSSMETLYERRSALFETGDLPGSRRDTVKNISKAGKVGDNNESVKIKASNIFMSPTMLFCVLIFVLITLDIL